MKPESAGSRPLHASPDVLVVGGGVIGLATAWRLVQRGASVAVADPAPGRGASWAAAGMLAPVTEVHYGEEPLLHLNLASGGLYTDFVAELEAEVGIDVDYRRAGAVVVARDRDDNEALEDLYRYQRELGLKVERLSGRECRSHEPALSPRTRGGILVPDDHQVDNRALVEALLSACARRGVSFLRSKVAKVERDDERVAGVRLEDGVVVPTRNVLLASGAHTDDIGGLAGAGLPRVRPVKGQLIQLRGAAPLVRGIVRGLDVYMVGRSDGRLVVGATVEEQGFDLRATAGAVLDLLRAAYELVPGITELEIVETAVGSRPATPDNAPLLGPTEVAGLTVATGHYRNGVLLAPLTAAALAEVILEDRIPDTIADFTPARFRRRDPVR